MFKDKGFNIKEITSVDLIKPKPSEKTHIYYGNVVPKYELVYKLSGEVITHFKKETFHIKPGAVYIIPKCDDADYHIERTVPGDCIDIFFDTDSAIISNLFILDFDENGKIKNLFQNLHKLWILKPEGYYFKCMAYIYEIFYEMQLKHDQYFPKSKYKLIEPGVEYLHNNLYNVIDYHKPSEICGISYTYFKKLFLEKFGVPPVRYVNNLRLERSRELLLTNKYPIGEIAQMCGFENAYYFSRKFKEKYRSSPTSYKNNVGSN